MNKFHFEFTPTTKEEKEEEENTNKIQPPLQPPFVVPIETFHGTILYQGPEEKEEEEDTNKIQPPFQPPFVVPIENFHDVILYQGPEEKEKEKENLSIDFRSVAHLLPYYRAQKSHQTLFLTIHMLCPFSSHLCYIISEYLMDHPKILHYLRVFTREKDWNFRKPDTDRIQIDIWTTTPIQGVLHSHFKTNCFIGLQPKTIYVTAYVFENLNRDDQDPKPYFPYHSFGSIIPWEEIDFTYGYDGKKTKDEKGYEMKYSEDMYNRYGWWYSVHEGSNNGWEMLAVPR